MTDEMVSKLTPAHFFCVVAPQSSACQIIPFHVLFTEDNRANAEFQ